MLALCAELSMVNGFSNDRAANDDSPTTLGRQP